MVRDPFLNSSESKAFDIMQPFGIEHNCRIFAKVKLADILEIRGSGLDDEHFAYASRAHFDFIIVKDNAVKFAIELDGPRHYQTDGTRHRDHMKHFICRYFDFELLRIDLGYLNETRNSHVLPILLQNYFQQENSTHNRKDKFQLENFNPHSDESEFSAEPHPLEQNDQVRQRVGKYKFKPRELHTVEGEFHYVAKIQQVDNDLHCIGLGSAHSSKILGTDVQRLADLLADIDLEIKISSHEKGGEVAQTSDKVEKVRKAYTGPVNDFPSVRKLVVESYTDPTILCK